MPMTKEEIKIKRRLRDLKNKDKIIQKKKEWYEKNKEQEKERSKLYHQTHKEERNKQSLIYNNKYYELNKEKLKQNQREYNKTEQGKKYHRISSWNEQGILCFDWDMLYDIFLSTTNCEFCDIELTTGRYNTSTTKCLDHDHSINDMFNVRGVLCQSCNTKDVLK